MSNSMEGQGALPSTANDMSRPALGEKSPNINVRQGSYPSLFRKKPMAGSTLKRSFTALQGGQGHTYLKRRKLSTDTPLSQVSTPTDEEASRTASTSAERITPPENVEQPSIPTINQAPPIPTEHNTPTSSPKEEDSADERRSFSSPINYDPSSQTAPPTSTDSGPSNAQLLKLRLKVAMYKVQTNQITTPFSDLEIPSAAPVSVPKTIQDFKLQMSQQARLAPIPALLPAPILQPTAYSSRMIYERKVPSSSPPGAGLPPTTPGSSRANRPDEQELTSSIVKGRVAEGLLGLRDAV